jgi:hypothetical protein
LCAAHCSSSLKGGVKIGIKRPEPGPGIAPGFLRAVHSARREFCAALLYYNKSLTKSPARENMQGTLQPFSKITVFITGAEVYRRLLFRRYG